MHPRSQTDQAQRDFRVSEIIDYLRVELPAYPFDLGVDQPFVEELVDDFSHLDVLEQIKAFRWYHDNIPCSRNNHTRLALRRWILRARAW